MNKVVVGSVLGIGGTGASLTGAYSLGMFGGNGVDTSSQKSITEKSPTMPRPDFSGTKEGYYDWKIQDNLDNLKSTSSPDCIKKTFPGITQIDQAQGYKTFNDKTSDKDLNFSFSKEKDSDGCLVVTWSRKESTESGKTDKYTGNFTLLWSFAQENKGFFEYANIDFEKYNKSEASVDGLIYVLTKEEGENKHWKIDSEYEVRNKKISNAGDKLPKPGNSLDEIKDMSLWGMQVESKQLVPESDLGYSKINNKEGGSYWKWLGSKEEENKITNFSSNFKEWWQELFGDCKNKIPNAIETISGRWEKVLVLNEATTWTTN